MGEGESIMNWYVLHAESQNCKKIVSQLNSNEEINAFQPRFEKWFSNSKIKEFQIGYMYPGYIFIKTELSLETLKNRYMNEYPVFMMDASVKTIMEKMMDDSGIIRCSKGDIINKKLKVYEGPLKGLEDNVKHINRHKKVAFLDIPFYDHMLMKIPLEVVNKL